MLNSVMGRGDDIGRYKDKYEESMNPFEAFKGRVGQPPAVFSWSALMILGSTTGYTSSESARPSCVRVD